MRIESGLLPPIAVEKESIAAALDACGRRIHECVYSILVLKSEPMDARL